MIRTRPTIALRTPAHAPGTAPDIAAAAATLFRSTGFLGSGRFGTGEARVMGNALREIDRFLNLLADAVADRAGLRPERFMDCRNTALKLRLLRAAFALPSPDDHALRAIGRSRDCLFHTGGIVRGRGRGAGLGPTAGWAYPDAPAPVVCVPIAIGSRIGVDRDDLARICRFYDRIAQDLIAVAGGSGRID